MTGRETEGRNADAIGRIWDDVWVRSHPADVLQDRFTREAYRAIRSFVTPADRAILEAGCGTGRFCALLGRDFPDCRIVGVDRSEPGLALARAASRDLGCTNVEFAAADLFSLPYPDGTFDLVLSEGVVPMFPTDSPRSDRAAVAEMARVARPGGRILVAVANWACFPHTFYKWRLRRRGLAYEYGHEKSYRRGELRRLLAACGLTDVAFTGYYPSYGFHRLASRSTRLARPLQALGGWLDRLDVGWVSRRFGFQTVAVGRKPSAPEAP